MTLNTTKYSYEVSGFCCCDTNCDVEKEEHTLLIFQQLIPSWISCVNNTFTAMQKNKINAVHQMKHWHTVYQRSKKNGKLPLLGRLNHDYNLLYTTVYRKPTYTSRLWDKSSYNPSSHKATTIRTLTQQAQIVCNTTHSLSKEKKYLDYRFFIIRQNVFYFWKV